VDPRFSPDGTRISFLRVTHRSLQELYVIPAAGGEARQITHVGKRISSHDWSRASNEVLIASERTGEFRVWRVRLSNPASMSAAGIYGDGPILFSAARRADALVYSTFQRNRNIWRLDLHDRSWRRIAASSAQDASPLYSPDGSRICFRSDRGGDEQLWVASADGSNAVQITRDPITPSVGKWSPDGRSIVFNNPRTFEISVATEGASGWSVRAVRAKGVHPAFSSDGRSVIAGGAAITRVALEGGPPVTLAPVKAEAMAASADGKYIYFVRDANASGVWRLPLDRPGQPERAFDGLLPGCTSCWALAPDGAYYLGTQERSFQKQAIYFHSFTGGPDRLVAEYPEALWPQGSGPFSLSPDGRNLLCVRVNPADTDVMLVSPFR
jgi:dipeptidyl aminopeptidase/acylaminoacyl peptidase